MTFWLAQRMLSSLCFARPNVLPLMTLRSESSWSNSKSLPLSNALFNTRLSELRTSFSEPVVPLASAPLKRTFSMTIPVEFSSRPKPWRR
jgi:hypothetical protein